MHNLIRNNLSIDEYKTQTGDENLQSLQRNILFIDHLKIQLEVGYFSISDKIIFHFWTKSIAKSWRKRLAIFPFYWFLAWCKNWITINNLQLIQYNPAIIGSPSAQQTNSQLSHFIQFSFSSMNSNKRSNNVFASILNPTITDKCCIFSNLVPFVIHSIWRFLKAQIPFDFQIWLGLHLKPEYHAKFTNRFSFWHLCSQLSGTTNMLITIHHYRFYHMKISVYKRG